MSEQVKEGPTVTTVKHCTGCRWAWGSDDAGICTHDASPRPNGLRHDLTMPAWCPLRDSPQTPAMVERAAVARELRAYADYAESRCINSLEMEQDRKSYRAQATAYRLIAGRLERGERLA